MRSPSPTLSLLPRGWAGGAQHRSESAARSTPTLPTRAQRAVGKDTPKKITFRTSLFYPAFNYNVFLIELNLANFLISRILFYD
ncbi:MAG: hypothetical protein RML94_03570 [Bacteroidia bacterium]|nr:hypothetical protein [Bacteroidia bacterium]